MTLDAQFIRAQIEADQQDVSARRSRFFKKLVECLDEAIKYRTAIKDLAHMLDEGPREGQTLSEWGAESDKLQRRAERLGEVLDASLDQLARRSPYYSGTAE